jgi:hypothetical protein
MNSMPRITVSRTAHFAINTCNLEFGELSSSAFRMRSNSQSSRTTLSLLQCFTQAAIRLSGSAGEDNYSLSWTGGPAPRFLRGTSEPGSYFRR